MKLDSGELIATGAELSAAPGALGLDPSELSRLPRIGHTPTDEETVRAFLATLSDDFAAVYRAALETLARPDRVGVLHYSLGEESVSRAILAWGAPTGRGIVLMVRGDGDQWRLRVEPAESLRKTIATVVLEDTPLSPVDIRCAVTHEAAAVFLAAIHLLRENRLLAMLSHREAPRAFDEGSLADVLKDSGTEDFRWSLPFFDKVMPVNPGEISWEKIVPGALGELAARDLVAPAADGKTWHLTASGYRIALADHHQLTKFGLRISEINKTGKVGHEGLLGIRSLHDLFLFNLAGREAVVAAADFNSLGKLLEPFLFRETLERTRKTETTGNGQEHGSRSCPACAARIPADAAFCKHCGMALTTAKVSATEPRPEPESEPKAAPPALPRRKFCAHCGAPLKPTAKFCGGCGKAIPAG
ncbi:MAG: zinc ribbon domain-containing protein [Akkermansiaceae bacterium]|nr:zinc ribbon domain-containing protein [Akkermansiaceae bacterium]